MARILHLKESRDSIANAAGETVGRLDFLKYIANEAAHSSLQAFQEDDREASIDEFHTFLATGSIKEALGTRYHDNLGAVFANVWEEAVDWFFENADEETSKLVEEEWLEEATDIFETNVVVTDADAPLYFNVVFLVPGSAFISPEDKDLYSFENIKRQLGERGFVSKLTPDKLSTSFKGLNWSEKHVDSFIRFTLDNGLSVNITPILSAAAVYKYMENRGRSAEVKIKGNPRIFYCYDRERRLGKILVSPKPRVFGEFSPDENGKILRVTIEDLPGLLDRGPDSLGSIVGTHLWKWR